jgi:hypothetical protein
VAHWGCLSRRNRGQPPNTVEVIAVQGNKIVSLVSGPTTSAARAALASGVVADAVVELETQLIELKKQLPQAK